MNADTKQYIRTECPESREAILDLVQESERIDVAGSQSHGARVAYADHVVLAELSAYRGILKYEPQEYVISARAGTTIAEISEELKCHHQYLPFDPPCYSDRTTIGGVIATGWSGPGCLRHGRLRDFIIGVDMISGTGRWIKGGGRVVKNAAGFDLPKLVAGSLGCFGIIGDIVLKVFPAPVSTMTIVGDFGDFKLGVEGLLGILRSGLTLDGCVLDPCGRLHVRISGPQIALAERSKIIGKLLAADVRYIEGSEDAVHWEKFRDTGPGFSKKGRCKVPIRPSQIPGWQTFLENAEYRYFYDQAGNVLIINIEDDEETSKLEQHLKNTRHSALVAGLAGGPRLLGELPDKSFINRIRNGLDPNGKFPGLKDRSII